jgi:eukaryotic-like serine/threonine-protein kinase
MQQHKEDFQPPTERRAGADPTERDRATDVFDVANERLLNLLEIWEDRYVRGREFSAESLAVDDPALLQALKSQIERQKRLRAFLRISPNAPLVAQLDEVAYERKDQDHDALVPEHSAVGILPSLPQTVPATIGRYQVTRVLGQGGFGRVFLAHDPDLDRDVAIKVPIPGGAAMFLDVEAYLREAQILARLSHPNIVPVYDVGRTGNGHFYVVSKYMDGGDLATRLRRGLPTFFESAALVAVLCDALHYTHMQDLFHRDIKPANILLDAGGAPYLADFGLALKDENVGKGARYVGTAAYMSPEQARGEGHLVDGRSDIFSIGVVLYEVLTGRRPFRGGSREEVMQQIRTAEARPPRQIDDAIPQELERICLKALSKRASERYTTSRDAAEDLRHFLRQASVAPANDNPMQIPPTGPVPEVLRAAVSAPQDSSVRSLRIVPKGLGSFDQDDADFFLELLPGPRDRDGLPDVLRFWKSRIEAIDQDRTFRVGLIYGPSGCGKSSLVKAGLLTRLGQHVVSVYVEATPAQTENRLVRGLAKRFPDLPASADLIQSLAELRRGHGLPSGHKVLLVLDQFEQWLFSDGGEAGANLTAALRQCDGEHLQALCLVRDDFWMAATRFMKDLEIDLIPDRNVAAVDLFDQKHTRKVLAAYGRAYEALPTASGEFTKELRTFLDEAVAGLAQDGRVVPIRLALFAEMVKDKPWTPATLREVHGMEGVGVRFLDDTFSAPRSNPNHRYHQRAAQAVLKSLLPDSNFDIKGRIRSVEQLRPIAGYGDRPDDFVDLIRILDTELRLITPVDLERSIDQDSQSSVPTGLYYQLTHDYLVHALREWLTRKQRETRRGRAQLMLVDRTALWWPGRERRHLPSVTEYLYTFFGTRRQELSTPERALMRAAGRHHGSRFGLLAACLLGLAASLWSGYQRSHTRERELVAHNFVSRLEDAPTSAVQSIVNEMAPLRPWIDPLLQQEASRLPIHSGDPRLLNLRLALLPADPAQAASLRQHLLIAGPKELSVIRSALTTHKTRLSVGVWDQLIASLWADLNDPSSSTQEKLCAACGLAELDPANRDQWKQAAPGVVACLLTKHSLAAGDWIELLTPVGKVLGPKLNERFCDPRWSDDQRLVAATALARFLHDEIKTMVELAISASPTQLAEIILALQKRPEEAGPLLEAAFEAETAPAGASERVRDRHATRRAAAAVALLGIGRGDRAFAALKGGPDPRVRTYLIHRFDQVRIAPEWLFRELEAQGDPSIQQALILALGQYDPMTLGSVRRSLTDHVEKLCRRNPYPGVHSSAVWLLDRLGEGKRFGPSASPGPAKGRDWYVNGQGQTFAIIREPKVLPFVDHSTDIPRPTVVRVGRSLAVATTEVTRRQFATVLGPEGLDLLRVKDPSGIKDPDRPVTSISYFDAAKFCRRLSELENIDPKEICYPPVDQIGPGMELPRDHLNRIGYRLPTEAEWVYTCLANAETIYPFGSDAEMSHYYARYFKNSDDRTWPVASLEPNDFGLFDILGNVYEWCEPFPPLTAIAADVAGGPTRVDLVWAPRGGSFKTRAHVESIVASYRKTEDPKPDAPPSWQGDNVTGFRVVRTYR